MPFLITQLKLVKSLAELINIGISQRLAVDENVYITIDKDNSGNIHTKIYNNSTDKIILSHRYQKSLGYEEIAKRIWEDLK